MLYSRPCTVSSLYLLLCSSDLLDAVPLCPNQPLQLFEQVAVLGLLGIGVDLRGRGIN